MDLFIATSNAHKVQELQKIFTASGLAIDVHTAEKLGGMPEVNETESTFEGNARLKAQALQRIAPEDAWILGDDSGIAVDALSGAPGIYSSRYAGPNASDTDNYQKLLKELEGIPEANRTAQFICCFVILHHSIGEAVFHGFSKGTLINAPIGTNGFGYDPIFITNGFNITNAQLDPDTKNKISHRALASQQLINYLKSL